MPRIDKNGNLEFHPIELPPDFERAADPDNPFIRKRFESVTTTRACKKCGKRFTLGVPYDPDDAGHDLCENCIMEQKTTQEYPEKTTQIDQTMLDAVPIEYQNEYQEEAQEKEQRDDDW